MRRVTVPATPAVDLTEDDPEDLSPRPTFPGENDTNTMPVAVICGEHDRMLEDAQALAAAVPHARLVVIPGAGHAPFHENKDAYAAALDAFLETLGPVASG